MTFLTTFTRVSLYYTWFQFFICTAMCQTSPCCGETLGTCTSQRYCTNWASVNEWTYVEAPCYTKCPLNIFIGMLCRSLLPCSKTKCITYQFTLNKYAWHPPPLNTESQEPQSKARGQFSPGPQPVLIALFLQQVLPNMVECIPVWRFRSAVGCLQSTTSISLNIFHFQMLKKELRTREKNTGKERKIKDICAIYCRTI